MKIIFVTGAPGSGKTFVANYICELMRAEGSVAQIGADFIRDILRVNISANDEPALHASSLKAGECAPIDAVDKAAWGYMQQAKVVINKGIVPVVMRAIEEDRNIVIEGVNCVPSLLNEKFADLQGDGIEILTIVIGIDSKETHLRYLEKQGDVDVVNKMGNIELIRHMQAFLIMDGQSVGCYICDGDDILDKVKNIVRAEFSCAVKVK